MSNKAKFLRSIGNVRWNGYGADLYLNADYSASIRFDKLTHPLPPKYNMKFSSLEEAENFIDANAGLSGLQTLRNILDKSDIQ